MPQTTRVAKPRVVRRRGRGKFYGDIRAEEIQNVRRGNVVGDQGLIGFVSKGGKQRSVALPPQAPKIISEYATSNVLRARSSGAYRRADPAISCRAELPETLCPHAHASRFSMIENSGPPKIPRQTNPEGLEARAFARPRLHRRGRAFVLHGRIRTRVYSPPRASCFRFSYFDNIDSTTRSPDLNSERRFETPGFVTFHRQPVLARFEESHDL